MTEGTQNLDGIVGSTSLTPKPERKEHTKPGPISPEAKAEQRRIVKQMVWGLAAYAVMSATILATDGCERGIAYLRGMSYQEHMEEKMNRSQYNQQKEYTNESNISDSQ